MSWTFLQNKYSWRSKLVTYRSIGTKDRGIVSERFIALAIVAANEQLWKPLNYSILKVCGNEKWTEVIKIGVSTLLSVIQTYGEEYIVLLPKFTGVIRITWRWKRKNVSASILLPSSSNRLDEEGKLLLGMYPS